MQNIAMSLVMSGIATSGEAPRQLEPNRPSKAQFVKRTFGKGAMLGVGAGAVIGEIHNTPHEWGQGAAGFGKRLGSSFAGHLVKNGIKYPVAYIRHEELSYRPSGKQGFMPRLTYALESTVVTRKTNTGKRTVAAGEISGVLGSGLISRLWMPASAHTLAAGFSSAGITLGADAGLNVAKEFWPRHGKPAAAGVKPPVAQRPLR
jgi:hypothetical protein